MTELTLEIPEGATFAHFQVEGEPVSKARARFTGYGSKVRSYTPEKTLTAEARIRHQYLLDHTENAEDADTTFGVFCVFYCGTRQRRDVDNMLKLVLDGLNKTAWKDDNQVLEVFGRKVFVPKAEARTVVSIYRIGGMDYLSKPCAHCGKSFRTWESLKDTTRFCSAECRTAFRLAARQTTCAQCGADFFRHGEKRDTRFCSRECGYEAGRVELACEGCGQPFSRQRSYVRARNYCSTECREKATAPTRARQGGGTCEDCKGPTSKKAYAKCRACRSAAQTHHIGGIRAIHIDIKEVP